MFQTQTQTLDKEYLIRIVIGRLHYPIELQQFKAELENELEKVCDCSCFRLKEIEVVESREVVSDWDVVRFRKVIAELIIFCNEMNVHKSVEVGLLSINDRYDIILSFNVLGD